MHCNHPTLESAFESYRIENRMHDVPPHEVYEVIVDGRRAVYKRNTGRTGRAEIEGRVLAFVGEQTSLPVPEILHVGADAFVAAYNPDAPAVAESQSATESWARAAGAGIATLHTETEGTRERDGYGQFHVENGELTVSGHETWHAGAREYVRQYRPTLARYGHADIADDVLAFLEGRPEAFAGAGAPVCCHGWATPEHVAVSDGDVSCLVDFEHAIAAPGEFDYWRTVLPTFGRDDSAHTAFREGYESVRSLPTGFDRRAPFYILLHEVYFFESLYVQAQHGPAETNRRAAWLRDSVRDRIDDEHGDGVGS